MKAQLLDALLIQRNRVESYIAHGYAEYCDQLVRLNRAIQYLFACTAH